MEKKVKKPTQLELLTDIRDLLIPMNDIARFQQQQILAQREAEAKAQEAKTSDDLNKDL